MPNTPAQDAERLQLRMQRIRRRLNTDVEDLVSEAQQLLDWKYYIRRHPVACVIAAATLGYMVVPRVKTTKETKVFLDPAVSREYFEKEGPQVQQSQVQANPVQKSLFVTAAALALNTLVRTGMSYAGAYVQQRVMDELKNHRRT